MANEENRGFASMDEEKQREIARKGGQSAPDEKRSSSKDPELASEAGRNGGEHSHGGQRSERDDEGGNSSRNR
jgi:general stress protein YciG